MFKIAKKTRVFRREADKLRGTSRALPKYPGSLLATYAKMYPNYLAPTHLCEMVDGAEAAKGGAVKLCLSEPPRSGKTELVRAIIVDRLMRDPYCRICYLSYAALFAKSVSGEVRADARRMGIPIDPSTRSKQDWRTGYGKGGLWATSIGGSITGKGFDLIIADDLMPGWEQAHSPATRETVMNFFTNDVYTRRQPGASVLVIGTRWHEQDAIGQLIEKGWPAVNKPAIDPLTGESYWPEFWDLDALADIRREMGGEDSVGWQALYCGQPRSEGDQIFRGAQLVSELPADPRRRAIIGVDYGYTEEKHSDYSVAVALVEIAGQLYVTEVIRTRKPEEEFRERAKQMARDWDTNTIVSSIAATERANVTLFQRDGVNAYGFPAIKSKKVRAIGCSNAWNGKKISVLSGQSWTEPFVKELMNFTGNSSRHDDQVDALVTAFDALNQTGPIDWDFADLINSASPQAMARINN